LASYSTRSPADSLRSPTGDRDPWGWPGRLLPPIAQYWGRRRAGVRARLEVPVEVQTANRVVRGDLIMQETRIGLSGLGAARGRSAQNHRRRTLPRRESCPACWCTRRTSTRSTWGARPSVTRQPFDTACRWTYVGGIRVTRGALSRRWQRGVLTGLGTWFPPRAPARRDRFASHESVTRTIRFPARLNLGLALPAGPRTPALRAPRTRRSGKTTAGQPHGSRSPVGRPQAIQRVTRVETRPIPQWPPAEHSFVKRDEQHLTGRTLPGDISKGATAARIASAWVTGFVTVFALAYGKASYEHATRLPRADEVFGATLHRPTWELEPRPARKTGWTLNALERIGRLARDRERFYAVPHTTSRSSGGTPAQKYQTCSCSGTRVQGAWPGGWR